LRYSEPEGRYGSDEQVIQDARLADRAPSGLPQNNWRVPAGTPTAHVFAWASAYAGFGPTDGVGRRVK
jgi:hypothetical protein